MRSFISTVILTASEIHTVDLILIVILIIIGVAAHLDKRKY
jgi:hypothetical protein